MYIVYSYRHIDTNRYYVGLTKNENQRKMQHLYESASSDPKFHFHKAIKKYGIDSFEYKVEASNLTQDQASEIEIDLISKYNSFENGFNMTTGGERSHFQGHIGERNGMFGKKHSEESRLKMSVRRSKKYGMDNPKYGVAVHDKGSNFIEMFGEERAAEIRERQSKNIRKSKKLDDVEYTFTNTSTGDEFVGTRYQFMEMSGSTSSNTAALLSGRIKSTKGWIYRGDLVESSERMKYGDTSLIHEDGSMATGTRSEIANITGLSVFMVNKIVRKEREEYKGWKLHV